MESNTGISPEVYKMLEEAEWDRLGKKMLAYTIWRARTHYGITDMYTVLPQGYDLEDIPRYIIVSLFDGTRNWKPERVELETWLLKQIDSVLDWWLNLRETRDIPYMEKENLDEDTEIPSSAHIAAEFEVVLRAGLSGPEETLVAKESSEEFTNVLFEEISGDSELEELYLAILEGSDPRPRFLANTLSIPETEIYIRKRRLKRHINKVLIRLGKANYVQI
jgi:hypothetical protein